MGPVAKDVGPETFPHSGVGQCVAFRKVDLETGSYGLREGQRGAGCIASPA